MLQLVSDYITAFNALYSLLGAVIICFARLSYKWHKRRQLERILTIKKLRKSNEYMISVPTFQEEILNKKRDVVIIDEMSFLVELVSLLNSVKVKTVFGNNLNSQNYDEIHIGGPVSNKYTNRYVNHLFKNFTWIVTKAHCSRYKQDKNLYALNYDFIEITKDGKQGFKIGENFYEYVSGKKGWAIVAKMLINESSVPKTIHLLFGCGTNGTKGAVDYFIHNYNKIHKINHRKQYIGIFEVDGDGIQVGPMKWLETSVVYKSI